MLDALLCCAPLLIAPCQEAEAVAPPVVESLTPGMEPLHVVARVWIPSPAALVDGFVGEAGLLDGLWESPLWELAQDNPGFPLAQMAWTNLLAPVDGELNAFLDAFAGDGLTLIGARRGDGPVGYGFVAAAQDADTAMECLQPMLNLAGVKNAQIRGERWSLMLKQAGLARNGNYFTYAGSEASALSLAAELAVEDPSMRGVQGVLAANPGATACGWFDSSMFQQNKQYPLPQDANASLLAADWHQALLEAESLGMALFANADGLRLRLEVAAAESLRESHAPFFPAVGSIPLPVLENTMATMILPRDLGAWWNARDLYMSEGAVANTVEGDANMALLFGRDPGSEIFAQLDPVMALVVRELPAEEAQNLEVEYPAAALRLKKREGAAEDLGSAFANAFQAAVVFANFSDGAMGAELLALDVERIPQGKLYTGRYPKLAEGAMAPARHNLSLALLLADDGEIWFSSSVGLLKEIASAPRQEYAVDGIAMEVDMAPVVSLLRRDRDVLIANRLLEEGGDEQAAEQFIDLALEAMSYFQTVTMHSRLQGGRLQLEVATQIEL